jgi:hypothetical protein
MDACLWDLLYAWCLEHHPALLTDEQGLQQLHNFIHRLLVRQQREDRRQLFARMQRELANKQ